MYSLKYIRSITWGCKEKEKSEFVGERRKTKIAPHNWLMVWVYIVML